MTTPLVIGLLLLAIVGWLSLRQRARQRDFTSLPSGAVPAVSPTSPPEPGDPSDSPDWPFRTDPYWGELMWDHERTWEADGAPPVGTEHVTVRLYADGQGPGAHHREWYEAARAQGDGLVRKAAALLVAELETRGVDYDALSLSEVHIGVPVVANGSFEGRLLFDPDHEAVDWIDVRSTDMWQTLEVDLEVIDPRDLEDDGDG